jgi:6-bladed beta-propeller
MQTTPLCPTAAMWPVSKTTDRMLRPLAAKSYLLPPPRNRRTLCLSREVHLQPAPNVFSSYAIQFDTMTQHRHRTSRHTLAVSMLASLGPMSIGLPVRAAYSQPNPPRALITEDLRLDAQKEDFPSIGRIQIGPRGVIAVPVYPEVTLKMFDSTGKYLGNVGRKGAGPGEFATISNVGWVGDTMWVLDGSQRRISFFGPDSKHIRTVAGPISANRTVVGTPTTKQLASFTSLGVQADGSIAGSALLKAPMVASNERSGDKVLVRITPSGGAHYLMPLPRVGEPDERFYINAGGLLNPIPFVTPPQYATSASLEHIVVLRSLQTSPTGGTVTVTLSRTTGDTLYSKTFLYRGEPIPKAVRDSVIAAELTGNGTMTEGPRNLRRTVHEIAKKKTPFIYAGASFVVLGLDNTVWLGLHPTAQGRKVLVFNVRGEAVASVILPPNTLIRQANARNMWTIETNDDGLNSVVRYRVTGIPCGSPACR